MTALSDSIEACIKAMLGEDNDQVDVRRNELAQQMGCTPSHITYVISTRFTQERGYRVYSRRGGGGYVRVIRMKIDPGDLLVHCAQSVGQALSQRDATAIFRSLLESEAISPREAAMLQAATADKTLPLPPSMADILRAEILRAQLLALVGCQP